MFAYRTTYKTLDVFRTAWQEVIDEVKTAHLHGVVVLNKNWFAYQKPYRPRAVVRAFKGDALMRFTTNMLKILRATHITPAAMHRYLEIETTPAEDTEEGPSSDPRSQ